MRIGVDVMGGDNAPRAILEGALDVVSELHSDDRLVLFGDASVIEPEVSARFGREPRIEVVPTTQVIGMDESPVDAVRSKKDASIVVACRRASRKSEHPLDAVISAGSTGANVTAAQMYIRRLPNVHRPGVAVPLPTFSGPVVLIDVGANIEPKAVHLSQYGIMGAVYAKRMLGIEDPRVAIMNVGGEEAKGTADMKKARDLLRGTPELNFIGFVEGRGVFNGLADVVVTDGVVGNVMLKLAEGLSAGIFKALTRELAEVDPELAKRLQPVVQRMYARHDYHEFGGAPLLGVNGVCLICHGSSEARTISNAVRGAKRFLESGVNQAITEQLGTMDEIAA